MLFLNIVLFAGLASAAVNSAAVQASYKARRGGTVGLFPFPRVGRSQFAKTWQISPEEFAELHSDSKRQGLIPFPRVGRSMALDPQALGGTRWAANGDAGNGMWFGPRLGRLNKRNGFSDDAPWTMIALREMTSQRDFTPRLGRESEELQTEDDQLELEPIDQDSNRAV